VKRHVRCRNKPIPVDQFGSTLSTAFVAIVQIAAIPAIFTAEAALAINTSITIGASLAVCTVSAVYEALQRGKGGFSASEKRQRCRISIRVCVIVFVFHNEHGINLL
jgi:hypothetical protein